MPQFRTNQSGKVHCLSKVCTSILLAMCTSILLAFFLTISTRLTGPLYAEFTTNYNNAD